LNKIIFIFAAIKIINMQIRIVNKSTNPLPQYGTKASAGIDLRANLKADIIMKPLERTIVPTGLYIEIPIGYEAQVRPRSGLAIKKGITVLNTPGTIDADYRGEIMIILINLSNEEFVIKHGERIAQMVIAAHEQAEWELVEDLSETERGSGGFGSTGV
jgi:dUTP pyrophosphatase